MKITKASFFLGGKVLVTSESEDSDFSKEQAKEAGKIERQVETWGILKHFIIFHA